MSCSNTKNSFEKNRRLATIYSKKKKEEYSVEDKKTFGITPRHSFNAIKKDWKYVFFFKHAYLKIQESWILYINALL